jgi:leader peptidase (prepilin peptidase)/N-methyltransferase
MPFSCVAAAFVFGLLFGSFLNVCVSRLPAGLSIITPGSRCPGCLSPIKFYDNIPLLSFLLLKGRCRSCSAPISWRYPATELFTGLVTGLFFIEWHSEPLWLAAALAAAYVLIAAALIDFDTMMISDAVSYSLAALGLAACFVNPYFSGTPLNRILEFLTGAVSGAAIVWFMAAAGRKLYGRDAVGDGDIFLMAGIGSLIGWQGILSTLMMASLFGSVYGVSLMLVKKARRFDPIPFGPFLALGALVNLYRLVRITDFII